MQCDLNPPLFLSFYLLAALTDVMTLDHPVNGTSAAMRNDYAGQRAKGEARPV